MNRSTVIVALLMMTLVRGGHCDSWNYKPTVNEKVFDFPPVKIVVETDARKDQKWPQFKTLFFRSGKKLAEYPGIAVETVVPSPNGATFIGLSNDGLPPTAIVVFGSAGDIRMLVEHGLAEFDYCEKSITRRRVWFDSANPDIRFDADGENNGTSGISLRDCHGRRVDLWDVAVKAYNKALQADAAKRRR